MKVQTASTFAVVLTTALLVPAAFGQQSTFRGPASLQTSVAPAASSVVLPMANPVAPMANPVGPFIRYGGPAPTVVNPAPAQGRGNNNGQGNNDGQGRGNGQGRDGQRDGRGRNVVAVPVYVPVYNYPLDYYPPTPTVTIPGQLPGVPYRYNQPEERQATSFNPSPDKPAPTPPASTFDYVPQPETFAEPRVIINEPRPNRVIQVPPAGTSRADVIARLGQPWGQFSTRGIETLYFDGITVVLGPDARVTSTR